MISVGPKVRKVLSEDGIGWSNKNKNGEMRKKVVYFYIATLTQRQNVISSCG